MLDILGCPDLVRGEELRAVIAQLQQTGCTVRIDMKDPARPAVAELQAKVDGNGQLNLASCWLQVRLLVRRIIFYECLCIASRIANKARFHQSTRLALETTLDAIVGDPH